MKKIQLIAVFVAGAALAAGCAVQEPQTATAGASKSAATVDDASARVHTGSRIPRRDTDGVQTIDGEQYKRETIDRGMPQVNPKGG